MIKELRIGYNRCALEKYEPKDYFILIQDTTEFQHNFHFKNRTLKLQQGVEIKVFVFVF